MIMPSKKVISKSLIPENLSFIVKKIDERYFDPTFHAHPEFQLSFVIKGEGNRIIGNSLEPFYPNDMVFIGPNLPHVWKNHMSYFEKNSTLDTTVLVIYFHKNFLGDNIYQKQEFLKLNSFFEKSNLGIEITGETRDAVGKMMFELLEKNDLDSFIQLLKILNTMVNSSEYKIINKLDEVITYKQGETERLHKVYDFVNKNFDKPIKLEQVAEIANMTSTSFSRYFKTTLNKSFSDFLKEIRVNYACKLLKDNNTQIETISYQCGYPSITNFNKQFKSIIGLQPKLYRKEYMRLIQNKA